MDILKVYYANLYQQLISTCPFDYANITHPHMKELIEFHEYPEHFEVIIRAKDDDGRDYSKDVNEALNAIEQHRSRSQKEEKNYHWINRALDQAARLTAEKVEWEGGFQI